jgi:ABC-type branched-subunit amino acid transport system ATPase component/ABC-type branched-subunit amino acid transport system permease subunit
MRELLFLSPRRLARGFLFLVLLVWPLIYHNAYALSNMRTAGLYALMALGTNLIMGQAGQLSFGSLAFAGIGGYTAALTAVRLHWSPLGGIALGIILACGVAIVVGKPVLKLRLYFLALATMALVIIFTVVVQTWRSLTFGPAGVPAIPWLSLGIIEFDNYLKQYYLVWIIVIAVLLVSEAAMRSRVGRALHALAVNETAAASLGIDCAAWKLRAFVGSAVICSLGGGLWSLFLSSATPSDFSLGPTILVVIMVMIGGMESLLGAVIGAIIISWLTFSLGSLQQYSGAAYAMVLILLVLFLPNGLAGLASTDTVRRLKAWLARSARAPEPAGDVPLDTVSERSAEPEAAGEDGPTPVKAGIRLALEDVTVSFGGLQALSQVSLATAEGGITAVIGPNGAGKTTLFNVVSGLQRPTSGHVWYRGRDLSQMSPVEICRLGIARTFQNLRIFENMSVLDNVLTGRHRHERSKFLAAGFRLPSQRREELKSRNFCLRVLEVMGLGKHAHEMAASLPYGQQRLVEIARALVSEPSLLLLDEPAAGMNQSEREVLSAKILDIAASGIDVLLVEHDMEMIMGISGHVNVLDHGRLICGGRPEEVQCNPDVIEAYLGLAHETERKARVGSPESIARPDSTPILTVENLSIYYGAIGAVRDVSFHIREGECVAILGANGAGKSTLLRTISGSLDARSGRILLDQTDITHRTAPQIVKLGICQVLEGRHVFPTLTVFDNLLLGAGKQIKGKVFSDGLDSVYELFPKLEERRAQTAGSLSGGEQQMLAIGRALMGRPRVLILDEPSMGLAPIIIDTIFKALQVLNDKGLTLLMVEQNATAALSIADRGLVLVNGKVALEGRSSELQDNPRLHDLYLGGTG